jgi:hypothetical protein
MRSNLLFDMMRNTCSTWMSRSDRELLEDAKRFVMEKAIESSIDGGSSGSCAMGAGGKSSAFPTGGKNSFSPKKKIIDSRPAILSRHSWTITIDRRAGTVTVEGNISSLSMLFNHFQTIIFFYFNNHLFAMADLTLRILISKVSTTTREASCSSP